MKSEDCKICQDDPMLCSSSHFDVDHPAVMSKPDIEDTDWLKGLYMLIRAGKDPDTGYLHLTEEDFITQIQAKFKENYKRLALDVIGEDDPDPKLSFCCENEGGLICYKESKANRANELRAEQRATLDNQLNNMKGE